MAYRLNKLWKRIFLQKALSKDTPAISVTEAFSQKQNYLFLDSRAKREFDVSHIKNAKFIGYPELDQNVFSSLKKDEPIIVYCSVGVRSDASTKALMAAGFTNVKNLYGGIFEWFNAGFEIVDNEEKSTANIHAFSRKFGLWLNHGIKIYE